MRRNLLFVLGGAVLLIALWSGGWFWIAHGIISNVETWSAARRAEGLSVAYRDVAVTGFPFRLRVRMRNPDLAGAGPTAWHWRGDVVEARVSPLQPRQARLRFSGQHLLEGGDGSLAESWLIRAEQSEGMISVERDGRLANLSLALTGAVLLRRNEPIPVTVGVMELRVAPHRVAGADHQTDTFDLTARLDDAVLPRAPYPMLGPHIARATLDLSFKGPLRGATLNEAVTRWRDDGGVVDINHLTVLWSVFDGDGEGTLALDEQNRPLGAFTARWRGYGVALDALTRAGFLQPREAAFAKIALNLLARQRSNGPDGEAQVPLTAQDGKLFAAGAAILDLEPLRFE